MTRLCTPRAPCRFTTYRHRFARAAPAHRAKRNEIQRIVDVHRPSIITLPGYLRLCCLGSPGFVVPPIVVGLQPTVIASRAPHLLLEQSVILMTLRFKESWTCIARQLRSEGNVERSRAARQRLCCFATFLSDRRET